MSYTPFKMAPKGPIMKKYHSAKGKSPYEYEKDSKDFVDRKNKEEVNKVKSKTSAHGQLNDAEEEARNDIKLKNTKPKVRAKNKVSQEEFSSSEYQKKVVPHSGGFTQKELDNMTEAQKEGNIDGYVAKKSK